MKSAFFISRAHNSFSKACAVVATLSFGVLASSAQTGDYLYSGTLQTITLNPGTYYISAYGAQGGGSLGYAAGGLGAEMVGEFSFSGLTTLTLLVGGAGVTAKNSGYPGGGNAAAGGGGGGGSFVVNGSIPLVIAGGGGGGGANTGVPGAGGGSIIDSSAIAILTEVSGVASPDGSPNGEIIITAVPEPAMLALGGLGGLSLLLFRRRRK